MSEAKSHEAEDRARDRDRKRKQMNIESAGDKIVDALPGTDPLSDLVATQMKPTTYVVLSASSGDLKRYETDPLAPSCTCDDFDYNTSDEGRNVCKHIVKAQFVHPQWTNPEDMGMYTFFGELAEVSKLRAELQTLINETNQIQVDRRSIEADQSHEDANGNEGKDPVEIVRDHFDKHDVEVYDLESQDGWVHVDLEFIQDDKVFRDAIVNPDSVKASSEVFDNGQKIKRSRAGELL